ncbi:TRAP transporter small permease [Marinivivus vitaminiproducens]|uniref:TRAP transporter small permease n=1 Tax=Marinivivus vitaminiproducens TaxID=3035935 RepID=UPI0027A2111E|nr:TRAP transporter small permease [Geminicoccaceae bacterium SCSIO 64248]
MAICTFILTWLVRIGLYAAGLIGLFMSVLVFCSVMMRYIWLSPLRFTDELVGLLFAGCVFLAIPFVFAMDLNIRVTLISDHLPRRLQSVAAYASNLSCVVFFLLFGYLSYDFASFSLMIGARSDIAQIPVGPWMALMPVSCFLTVIVLLTKLAFARKDVTFGTPQERRIEGAAG